MKKFLCFIGSAVYGVIVSYLMWFVFQWLTNISIKTGIMIGSSILLMGLLIALSTLIAMPLIKMCSVAMSCLYLPCFLMLFYCYCSVAYPWHLHPHGFNDVIHAVLIDISALIFYLSTVYTIWDESRKKKREKEQNV